MWIKQIVGDFSQKKSYLDYKARVKKLPGGYRRAAQALERYVLHLGPSGDSTALIAMLNDLAELFEHAASDLTPIRALLGDEPSEFAEIFLENYTGGSWIRKERRRLADSIDEAIAEQQASE
ncbi:MAG: DUF1048 domain-containing protein [Microbacteriaceae bacterium]